MKKIIEEVAELTTWGLSYRTDIERDRSIRICVNYNMLSREEHFQFFDL